MDEILGYEFITKKTLPSQPFSIRLSAGITMIIFSFGIINVILSYITFSQPKAREVGCGLYLLALSMTSLSTMIFFALKFSLLYLSYQDVSNVEFILTMNCRCIEILLKLSLFIGNWLNACIAIERSYTAVHGLSFSKRSRHVARKIIPWVFICNITILIPQIMYLHVFEDEIEGRSWCVIHYKSWLKKYTLGMTFVNYFGPLSIQILSTLVIIIATAYQRLSLHEDQSFRDQLKIKFIKYKQLVISPIIITALTLPHLIISVILDCRKSSDLFGFFLSGYFLSFIPAASIFIIYVIPSPLYREQINLRMKYFQRRIIQYLEERKRRWNN